MAKPKKTEFDAATKEMNGDWQGLVEHCFDLYSQIDSSEYRQAKIDMIKEARKTYDQKAEKVVFPWKDASNVILPLTTITVDNLEPRLVAALTGKAPIVQFEMEGLTEQDEQHEIMEDWFNSELDNVVKIHDVSREIVHTLLAEGTCYPIPRYEVQEARKRDFVYGQDGQIQVDEETGEPQTRDYVDPLSEGGTVDYAEFTDMYVPDNAKEWEDTEFIRVVRPTYAELMRVKDEYGYQNIGPHLLKGRESKLTEESQSPGQQVEEIKITGKETVECMECHLSWVYQLAEEKEEDLKDFEEDRIIALIARDSQILIRLLLLRDLNFKNEHLVKRVRLYPERGKAYGSGIYEKLQSIQKGASGLFNLTINIATVVMMPWFIYGNKAGLEGDVELYPGKGVPADDPTQVVFPKFNINPGQFVEFINMFIALWERLSSIGDLQVGRPSQEKKTASEVLSVIQEGNIKHNYQSKVFKEEFLGLLRTIYDLYYQNMPFDKTHQYRGEPVQLPRQLMQRKVKFKLTGSTDMANKVLQRKIDEDFYTLTAENPMVDQVKRLEDLVKTYKPDADPKEYINPVINEIWTMMQEDPGVIEAVKMYVKNRQEIVAEIQGAEEQAKEVS
jgi:hypothetical protein